MTSKIQTSFFIKSIKQNNQQKYNNSFKKNKNNFCLKKKRKKNHFRKKRSSGIIPEEHFFRKSQTFPEEPFFQKVSGIRVLPENVWFLSEEHFFRKVSGKCSSGSFGRTHNGSSGSLAVSPLSPFFPAPPALVFYPMVPLT